MDDEEKRVRAMPPASLEQAKEEMTNEYGDFVDDEEGVKELVERRMSGYCVECALPLHDCCGTASVDLTQDTECTCCIDTRVTSAEMRW